MKRLLLILAMGGGLLAMAQKPARVPAYPGPIERIQPNGDTIHVRLHGDERGHRMTTVDGYLVVENQQGWICYARKKTNGKIVATTKKAHNKEQRTRCEQQYIDLLAKKNKNTKK